jgi:hypothetical protein
MNMLTRRLVNKRQYLLIFTVLILFILASGLLTRRSAADDKDSGSRNSGRMAKAPRKGDTAATPAQNPEHANAPASMLATQAVPSPSAPRPVLAIADFDLLGLAVTINPSRQTVPKNTPTIITTSVQTPVGVDPAQIIATLNPNYRVRGELTGPSFTSPLPVEAPIGQPLNIPALSRSGDHLLQNLRVVDTGLAGSPVVASVAPDSAGISVIDQLLISEVHVEEMTYDQIIQSGISITDDSYQFFNFVLALATSSQAVNINIPVAFPEVGAEDPRPVVGRPNVNANIGTAVPELRFGAAPVMLEAEADPLGQEIKLDGQPVRIPGVVVIPGRVGFLHQFFEAIVIVANGAPQASSLVVKNLRAQVVLPDNGTPNDLTDDPLRIAATQVGGQVSELALHGLGADGAYGTPDDVVNFSGGQSGQGTFLLEGLKEGLHSPNFKLTGTLEGLPTGPITVRGEVPGAVLVRDASFSVTFSHPNIVRAGNNYDLAMTLYNSSSRVINGAIARLNANGISGANLIGNDTGERAFATTIQPKSSSTVVWRLHSNTTGAVTASYVKVGQGVEAGLNLVTGVGDRNIPLSPDSLFLPNEVRFLPPEVVDAGRALLGQAWSIANAPRGSLPQGVLPINPDLVIEKAEEIGVAGLRVEFNEPTQVSLETLMRDWLGENSTAELDPGLADAMRDTVSGYNWYDSVGAYLFSKLTAAQPLTAGALHQELANAESPRSSFLSALVTQPNGAAIVGARLIDPTGHRTGFLNSATDRVGENATGASLQLNRADGGATVGQLLLVSRPVDGNWTLELTGWQSGTVDLSLLVPSSSRVYRQIIFNGVTIAQGGRYRVVFRPNSTNSVTLEEFRNGAFQTVSPASTINTLNEPAPRVVGVLQANEDVVTGGDKYGRILGLLFSKPMQKTSAETASRYTVGGGGVIGANPPVSVVGKINVAQAKLNLGGRFVFLGLDSSVGPFIRRDLTLRGIADARGVELPSPTTSLINMSVSPQGNPPGAYLTGRVLLADGTPVVNAPVTYSVPLCNRIAPEGYSPLAIQRTDAQGRYSIDYVRNGDCGSPIFKAVNLANNSTKQISTPVVYQGQNLNVDLVFLARGKVSGNITIGGAVAANAFVRVVPTLETSSGATVQADGLGHYLVEDLPVGPISVLAVGARTQSNATGVASGNIDGPNQTAIVNVALQTLTGVIRGRVLNADASPSVGALVVASTNLAGIQGEVTVGFAYTGRDGSFTITNLPLNTTKLVVTDALIGFRLEQTVQLSQAVPEVTGVIITLPGYGSISGKVLDEAGHFVPFAPVYTGSALVISDVLGFYSIPKILAGTYTVTAKDPLSDATGATAATVRLNENTANVNISITRPGTINGQVFIQNVGGQPTPVAETVVTFDGIHKAKTDAQGRYTLRGVPANTVFTLRFVHPNNRLAVNYDIFVSANETITRNATFKPSSLRGKISQPDGVTGTVAEVTIRVPLPSTDEGNGYGLFDGSKKISTQSAADGTYSVSTINSGVYRVTASNSFFPTSVSKGGTLLGNEEQVCNITLVNTLAGKIQGRVFQPDGVTPVGAGIPVTLGGGSLADVTVRTDQTGHYEFAEVFAEGNYLLTALDTATGNTNRLTIAVRANQDTIADIRLLGRGSLRVRVVDGGGNPVTGGQINVDSTGYPNLHRFTELSAQSGNVILYDNLNEGSYAVVASQNGLSGRVAATVPTGSTVEVTIQLRASGTVEGRVLMPDGTTSIPFADVSLFVNNQLVGVTITTDADGQVGKFSFTNVPAGEVTLEAFDNRTGRRGRASGSITAQGQTATVDVKLIPVGAVTGIVRQNGTPVDHALVTISASGLNSVYLSATTTSDGRYRFTGIPAGPISVSASSGQSGMTGFVTGSVNGTVEPLPDTVLDITLEPSLTVIGNVYKLGGVEPAIGAKVTLMVGSRQFQTTTNQSGAYRINFVPLGELRVRAEEPPTGYNRGEATPVIVTQAGATQTINVTLAGTGIVSGTAQDNTGAALTSGTVTFANDAFGSPVIVAAQVQANGHYEIKDVPAGAFSLRLTVPGRPEVGVASGVITANQTLSLNIKLEDAGIVTGVVKLPDGLTNAISADVKLSLLRSGSSIIFFTHTNAQGVFTFANVPLGTVNLSVSEISSGGIVFASGLQLATNGQTLNVGTLVLDNAPISVVSVIPVNNAVNVPRNSTVAVTFSEAALASSVDSSSIKLLQGATQVGASVSLSSDGKTATLTPSGTLADFTSYTVVVTSSVSDLSGHKLASEFRSSFVTRDETGPLVTAVSPLNNATNVALNSDVLVTFNEPLERAQTLSSVIILTFGAAPGTAVAGTVTLNEAGTVATFHPTSPLSDNTTYTVKVTGQRDVVGNVQPAVFTSSFSTVDQTPPVVDPLPIDGTRQGTLRPVITATYIDVGSGINTASVVLKLDGMAITSGVTVNGSGLTYQPPTALATGAHTVTVQVADNAGNQSAVRSASFTIDNASPVISSFTIAGVPAVNGMTVTSTLQPTLSASYSDDTGINLSSTRLLFGPAGSTPPQVAATVTATGLTYTPPTALAEALYVAEVIVVDNTGNQTTTGQIQFRIDVDAPDIATVTPANGNQHGGTTVTLTGARLLNANNTAPSVKVGGYAASVISATAGSPDQVVLVTPPGAPGLTTISITTDRGTGSKLNAFTYDADAKTPFAVEADTMMLWHLDETTDAAARILDAGPLSIDGTASTFSLASPGRFAGGRKKASITADTDSQFNPFAFASTSFTVECWMKTDPVARAYVLVGKSDTGGGSEDFNLVLFPSGALRAYFIDNGGVSRQTEMTATSYDVDDNQWHYVAMVVDRTNARLSLYVDGVERSFASLVGAGAVRNVGQPLRAGLQSNLQGGSTVAEFTGTLDEIRISNSAHSVDKIASDFYGYNAVRVASITPSVVQKGTTSVPFTIFGNGLQNATVTTNRAGVSVNVTSTSYTKIALSLIVADTVALGPLTLSVTDSIGQTTTTDLTVVDQKPFVNDPASSNETILLWHLDEPADGAVQITGVGDAILPAIVNGTASSFSLAATGRFSGGRNKASVTASSGTSSIAFASTSFTVECWMKTDPVARAYVLVGKSDTGGGSEDFNLVLFPSGALRAYFIDNGGVSRQTEMMATSYDVDDNQWHYVAMVVDRTNARLSLYVDGVERSFASLVGAGAVRNVGQPLRAGLQSNLQGGSTVAEFTGTLDEIRILNFARTTQQFSDTWFGTNQVGLSLPTFHNLQKATVVARGKEQFYAPNAPQPQPTNHQPPPAARRSVRATGGDR